MFDFPDYEARASRALEGQDWQTAGLILKKLLLFEPENEEINKKLIKCWIKLHRYDLAHQVVDSAGFSQELSSFYKSKLFRLQGKPKKALVYSNEKQKAQLVSEMLDYQLGDLQTDYKNFTKWFKNNGGTTDFIKIKLFDHKFRGISAKTFIEPGAVLISVPSHLILLPEICKKVLPVGFECKFQSYHSIFAVFLATELKNPASFWLPYLNILPKDFSNFPVFFSKKELNCLQGSSLVDLIEIQKQDVLRDFEYISNLQLCSFDEFLKAKLIVSSRLHSIKRKSDDSGLVPLADMFNHRPGSNAGWFFDFETKSFAVQTNQAYQRGEEVCIDYGEKSNLKLMLSYGFAVENNEFDEFFLRLGLKKNDLCWDLKNEIKGNREFFHVNMKTSSKLFKELLGFLRLRFCENERLLRESKEKFFNLKNVEVISKENEIKVLRFLKKKCQISLQSFCWEFRDKEKLDDRIRCCFLVVEGEKTALKWMIAFCDYFLNALDEGSELQDNKDYQDYINSLKTSLF